MAKKQKKRSSYSKRKPKDVIDVLYEDDDIIAIDKPPGLLSVPITGSAVPSAYSVLREQLGKVYIVHRLDRYSSGILMFARTEEARHSLIQQFLAHTPKREYRALVQGELKTEKGELVHHFKLGREGFRQQLVTKKAPGAARAALTYSTVKRFQKATLIEVTLQSGLKNQIRAQFAAIGHPLIGERQYADASSEFPINHQALYASRLEFDHPMSKKRIVIKTDAPRDFVNVMQMLKSLPD